MNNIYKCIYCNSSYYHKENLTLHYTYCKIKKKQKKEKSWLFELCMRNNY